MSESHVDVQESERAARDKARYHPADPKDYGSPIGMPYEDENGETQYACVGCWHCCPEEAECPPAVIVDEAEARRQASDDDRDGMICT